MLDSAKLIEWSDEASRADDFILAQILLHLATLKNLSDYRGLEICRNYARMRANNEVAAHKAEVWDEVIDG